MVPLDIYARAWGYYIRKTARLLFRRPFPIKTEAPLISFTFDDFPRSALLTGGAILKRFGLAGTYYASFGLMGKQGPVGSMFLPEDVRTLFQEGHELGCHTFSHCNSATTKTSVFEDSILKNRQALSELFPGTSFRTFAYPLLPPRPRTKQKTGRHFLCCRCGDQNFNRGTADLNHLSAYLLEKSRNHPEAVKDVIDRTRLARGWLIFVTHDVCRDPSPFGCTPEFFEDIVQYAVNSGARILPVAQAMDVLCASPSS